jgi:glutamate/tyrosine decarboxylase-like PLP-dependent enzyme
VQHLNPRELKSALGIKLPRKAIGLDETLVLARKTLKYSVSTGHPRFLNQLFGGADAAAILGEWISTLTNTSMYTYEAAPVGTLVELAIIERLAEYVGFTSGEGVFAPGGSIANLMAVLAARHAHFPHAKEEGLRPTDRPIIFVSEEAHYSLPRATMVAGFGTQGCCKIPVDAVGRMRTDVLEREIIKAKAEGKTPFLVAATAGTTVACAFDPIKAISEITAKHGLWLHIDGSYGGSTLFSEKHRGLLEGIDRVDSVTWNPHKMMGVPLACAALLVREKGTLVKTLGMNAEYLFHEESAADYDLGDRSLQCGRRVDALKLWFSWQAVGDEGYGQRIDQLFELAEDFRELIRERDDFRLIREQEGTNVCFRYLPPEFGDLKGEERIQQEHKTTLATRKEMAEEGSFLVNYSTMDGAATFRLVASNPQTTSGDLEELLNRISC